MKDYEKGICTRDYFLTNMGELSLKADRESKRLKPTKKDDNVAATTPAVVEAQDKAESDDSLSETRPWTDNSSDEDLFSTEKPNVSDSNFFLLRPKCPSVYLSVTTNISIL